MSSSHQHSHVHYTPPHQARYNASRIFLATDSPAAADRCAAMRNSPTHRFRVRCDAMPHAAVRASLDERVAAPRVAAEGGHKVGHNFIEARVRRGDLRAEDVGRIIVSSFADWEELAECDVFVGDLRSTFFRVALYLSMFRRGRVPPIISFTAGGFAPAIRNMVQDVNA